MAATKTSSDVPDTMAQGLQDLVPDIASCMAAPDADINFLDKLLKIVLLRLHAPQAGQQAGGPTPPGGAGAGASPMGGGPPGGAPAGPLPGSAPGGGAANPAMASQAGPQAPTPGGVGQRYGIPPDELRRILVTQGGE